MSQSPAVTSSESPDAMAAPRGRWQVALPVFGIALLALAVALHDPALRLWDLWLNSFEYGHGLVVVPVTLYLLWLRRDRLRAETPAPDWLGLVLTAGLMLAWFASRILGIVLGEQLALVLLLLTVTMAVLGRRVAAIAALPVLYILFAVPLWSYISPMMQTVTAEVSAVMVRSLGVPLFLEGLYMTIPDGRFLVAETCSGLRYLLAALSLGGFYALLNLHSAWARCVIVLFCVALGVVFNWIRVVGIVLIGHHTQMQSSIVGDHVTFGWVLFLGVVGATLLVGRLLERLEGPEPDADARAATGEPSAIRGVLAAGLSSAALVLAPAVLAAQLQQVETGIPELALPDTIDGDTWVRGAFPADTGWRPEFQGAHSTPVARYRGEDLSVDVYVAYYPVQRQDAEVVNDVNRLFDTEVWRRYTQEPVPTRVDVSPELAVSEYRLVRKDSIRKRRLVWWTYWVDATFTQDPWTAKWYQVRAALTGQSAAAAVVLSAESVGDDERTRERLAAFARSAIGPLQERLAAIER